MDLGLRQRENFAKALYDVGKLVLAFVVLGPLASPAGFHPTLFLAGSLAGASFFIWAFLVDKGG